MKYQRMKLRKTLLSVAEKPKMYKKEFEEESDLEQDWIDDHEENLVTLEREKIRKKFDKEQKKRGEDGEKPMKEKELTERLAAADELAKSIKADRKAKYTTAKGSEDKLVQQLRKLDERILIQKTNATDKDEGKGTVLALLLSFRVVLIQSLSSCRNLARYFQDQLHRSSNFRQVVQRARRSSQQDLLENSSRKVHLGRQLCRSRLRLVVGQLLPSSLVSHNFSSHNSFCRRRRLFQLHASNCILVLPPPLALCPFHPLPLYLPFSGVQICRF